MADQRISDLPQKLGKVSSQDEMILNTYGSNSFETERVSALQLKQYFGIGSDGGGMDDPNVPRTYFISNPNASVWRIEKEDYSGGSNQVEYGSIPNVRIDIPDGCVGGYIYYTTSFGLSLGNAEIPGSQVSESHIRQLANNDNRNTIHFKAYGAQKITIDNGEFVGWQVNNNQNGFQYRLQVTSNMNNAIEAMKQQNNNVSDQRVYSKFDYIKLNPGATELTFTNKFFAQRQACCGIYPSPTRFIFLPVFIDPGIGYLETLISDMNAHFDDIDSIIDVPDTDVSDGYAQYTRMTIGRVYGLLGGFLANDAISPPDKDAAQILLGRIDTLRANASGTLIADALAEANSILDETMTLLGIPQFSDETNLFDPTNYPYL